MTRPPATPPQRRSPGPTSSPGTSPTAATSPASTAISTPAARRRSSTESFADRSELDTEECFRVIDEIAAFAPECVTILTGGEPLLRRDILEIVRRAAERGPVGRRRHQRREASPRTWRGASRRPARAACRCRSTRSIPSGTTASGTCAAPGGTPSRARRSSPATGLPFIVQTTVGAHNLDELEAIAAFAHDRARREGLEPLLPGADGARAVRLGHHPRAVRRGARLALPDPADATTGRMLVNAKCAPHYIKTAARTQDGAGRRSRRPTRAGPAAARRARTTWGSGRTATSRPAPTSRSSREPARARASRTCGRPRSCSPTIRQRTVARRPLRRLRDERPRAAAAAPGPTG